MGRCQGEEKLGCSVGGRGDSRSHCETTKPFFKSYHSSPEPGWGWGNPGHIWVKGLTRKHSFLLYFIHTYLNNCVTAHLCKFRYFSFISEISTTVYLHTCILVCLAVEAGGARQSLGGASAGSGSGVGCAAKSCRSSCLPSSWGHTSPSCITAQKTKQSRGPPGSDWVSLGVGPVWIYKRGCSRTCD